MRLPKYVTGLIYRSKTVGDFQQVNKILKQTLRRPHAIFDRKLNNLTYHGSRKTLNL